MYKLFALTTLLFLVPISAAAKDIPDQDKSFDIVIEAPTKSKDQIYLKTKIWLAETFKSSKAVIEVDSKEDGLLIGNGIIKYPCKGFSCITYDGWMCPFTIKIEMKDDKFRVTFSNLQLNLPGERGLRAPSTIPISQQSDLDKIKPVLLQLATELGSSINHIENQKDF